MAHATTSTPSRYASFVSMNSKARAAAYRKVFKPRERSDT
jgi:hypothetical protein